MLNNTIDKTIGILSGLTQKIINIKQKSDQFLTNENYIELNEKIDILSGMLSSSTNESDIVSLLNLPRPISEYKNEHIGEIILIPYTDESGKILLNNGCIEFEVVGVNHHKDINDETKPTITLMTKNIIRHAAFDAKEPSNSDNSRAENGNNSWAVSNIRQWLNSEGAANEWFIAQHEYDEAPTVDKILGNEDYAYANDLGFLAGFSADIKSHFATVANTTWVFGTISTKDITNDKIFLPSYTEMFGYKNNNVSEGTHLSQKFTNDSTRGKTGASVYYWLRSSDSSGSDSVYFIDDRGWEGMSDDSYNANNAIAPLLVLC